MLVYLIKVVTRRFYFASWRRYRRKIIRLLDYYSMSEQIAIAISKFNNNKSFAVSISINLYWCYINYCLSSYTKRSYYQII